MLRNELEAQFDFTSISELAVRDGPIVCMDPDLPDSPLDLSRFDAIVLNEDLYAELGKRRDALDFIQELRAKRSVTAHFFMLIGFRRQEEEVALKVRNRGLEGDVSLFRKEPDGTLRLIKRIKEME